MKIVFGDVSIGADDDFFHVCHNEQHCLMIFFYKKFSIWIINRLGSFVDIWI